MHSLSADRRVAGNLGQLLVYSPNGSPHPSVEMRFLIRVFLKSAEVPTGRFVEEILMKACVNCLAGLNASLHAL